MTKASDGVARRSAPKKPAKPATRLQREAAMMNLERLVAERESVPDVALPIPQKELLARYERLASAIVSDVLREHCLLDQAFIKDPNVLVKDHISSLIAKLGENIVVKRFTRFALGEEA